MNGDSYRLYKREAKGIVSTLVDLERFLIVVKTVITNNLLKIQKYDNGRVHNLCYIIYIKITHRFERTFNFFKGSRY